MENILNFSIKLRRILPIFLLISLMGGYLLCADIPQALAFGDSVEMVGGRTISDVEKNDHAENGGSESHHEDDDKCGLLIDAANNSQTLYFPSFSTAANFTTGQFVNHKAFFGYYQPPDTVTGSGPLSLVMRC